MNKNKKKKKKILKKIIPIFIVIIMISLVLYCYWNVLPVQKVSYDVKFTINHGDSTREIVKKLKNKNLIKNENFVLLYIKQKKINNIKAGTFILDRKMKLNEIFETITNSKYAKSEEISITFPEGKTMRKMAEIVANNSNITYDEFINTVNDKEFIKSLIETYWFLDESVLNENIYYPLEGYLAPNTYNFKKDVTAKTIIMTLLDQTDTILTKEKEKIESSGYTVHQLLSLASIIESEGGNLEEKKNIAGVFMNRLKAGMALGSDVTTYYAFKIELGERDLYKKEINSSNPYNTRSAANAGKLPVGPICNPSLNSIIASIEYTPNDYYYFVADKNNKIYFSKNSTEHNNIINKLKKDNLWYEY